jgi:hypothetical protein
MTSQFSVILGIIQTIFDSRKKNEIRLDAIIMASVKTSILQCLIIFRVHAEKLTLSNSPLIGAIRGGDSSSVALRQLTSL